LVLHRLRLIYSPTKLAALYSHITAAERQQDNIDQSLSHIEQQQNDLSATLDAYERMSQELLGGQSGSLRTLDTGPADTERDKKYVLYACPTTTLMQYISSFNSYMLATDLHAQLDDLSGSLTQMIDAVNGLSVSNKPNGESNDDPMSQISQVLSSHLESLQWIDGAVREVEGKVSDIEKRVKDSGYNLTGGQNQGKSRGFGLHR
jgi:nuclear pore complex protein Nup62